MTSGPSGAARPACLTRPPSIDGSFGGNQMWTSTPLMQNCGCGIIAGLDAVLRYEGISTLTMDEYLKRFDDAARYLKPIVLPGNPENPKSFGVSTLGFKRGVKKLAASRGILVKAKGFIFKYLEVSSWGGVYRIELSDLDRASAGVRFYAVLPL